MNNLTVFNFQENEVRTEVIHNEPWFVAKDVCDILGIGNSRQALKRLEEVEKGVISTSTQGGHQLVQAVSESGLYALIFSSRKKKAKLFRTWVTSIVLPEIRKTGSYTNIPKSYSEALQLAADQAKKIEIQTTQIESQDKVIEIQQPKVEFYEQVTGSKNLIDMGSVAKVLAIKGYGRNNIFELLRKEKILIQYGTQPYQRYVDSGWFKVIETKWTHPKTGDTQIALKTMVYQKGLANIRKIIEKNNNV